MILSSAAKHPTTRQEVAQGGLRRIASDPAPKGGAENEVKAAKRGLVPTMTYLRASYGSFAEIQHTCDMFMAGVNGRVHRDTRRIPMEMLGEERFQLQYFADTIADQSNVVWAEARRPSTQGD
ncbi:hypothetical protein AB0M47_22605 [Hamadaea sp. NPDC051192]|uniref:hypothetical protein n=1 Tax=Hamadaea sp. NPDC051192 TaxID=3154940 RepID=UPI0034458E65